MPNGRPAYLVPVLGSASGVDSSAAARRQLTPLEPLVRGIESAAFLDARAKASGRAIRRVLAKGKAKDAISGTWLDHAVHPI
jgi:hypothetical protein